MEQIEFINTQPEDQLLDSWSDFVHTHRYEYHTDFYDSWLSQHPRRSGEAYLNQYYDARFIDSNPLPRGVDFDELWAWFQPLVEVERRESTT